MKFNDKTKEIFISQYDYGIPITFTAKNGFVNGDKIIFTFDNENILNKEYTVELEDNTFTFALSFTQAEAETILTAKLDSCFTIRYSVKHKRGDEFVDSLINSKLVVNSSVPIIHKRNYLVELENENRALKNTLANIADDIAASYTAANERGATLPTVRDSSNLPQTIRSIPMPDAAVAFYDYDGTVLHAYPERYVYSMQELPDPPTHSGLRFLGWNWTLEQIQNTVAQYPGKCVNVGALYTTVDGKTRIYIQLDDENETEFSLNIYQSLPDIVEVDWGDGSQPETTDDVISAEGASRTIYSAEHTYEPIGYPASYVITLTLLDDSKVYGFGGSFSIVSDLSSQDVDKTIRRIELGDNVSLGKSAFYHLSMLRCIAWNAPQIEIAMFSGDVSLIHLTIGDFVGMSGLKECESLESISAPWGSYGLNEQACMNCYSLKTIGVLPNGSDIATVAFYKCYNLTDIGGFPNCSVVGEGAFSSCYMLRDFIPSHVTTIGNSAYNCNYSNSKVAIPNSVSYIGRNAFYQNITLKEIDLSAFSDPNEIPTLGNNFSAAFSTYMPTLKVLVLNETMKTAFSNATNWSSAADLYVVKED